MLLNYSTSKFEIFVKFDGQFCDNNIDPLALRYINIIVNSRFSLIIVRVHLCEKFSLSLSSGRIKMDICTGWHKINWTI